MLFFMQNALLREPSFTDGTVVYFLADVAVVFKIYLLIFMYNFTLIINNNVFQYHFAEVCP